MKHHLRLQHIGFSLSLALLVALLLITPAHAQQSDAIVHIVAPGDSLAGIALSYGVSMQAIMNANDILNPDFIYVGQRLIIPSSYTGSAGSYVVQAGDTLASIARAYGLSLDSLVALNGLSNPSQIFAGQTLAIPGGTGGPVTAPIASSASQTHIVRQGETLFRISLVYSVRMQAIMDANAITSPERLYVGQSLLIPGASGAVDQSFQPISLANAPTPTRLAGKQIVVDLSEQRVYAFENGVLLRTFVVSTGLPATPTVTGDYAIYARHDSQRMVGPDYDLPGVPWVMYFYQGYGFHGTYWHNNFGQPMSHGCVNMRTPEAAWLYEWAPLGTAVRVIP